IIVEGIVFSPGIFVFGQFNYTKVQETVPSFLRFSPYRIRLCGDFELGSLSKVSALRIMT
ncbi:MAG: hypothetical protein II152_08295, partial [Succinivibrionaceae bacterium]|nr:hypothetical protein [Succinivibrionaceae bacterium]